MQRALSNDTAASKLFGESLQDPTALAQRLKQFPHLFEVRSLGESGRLLVRRRADTQLAPHHNRTEHVGGDSNKQNHSDHDVQSAIICWKRFPRFCVPFEAVVAAHTCLAVDDRGAEVESSSSTLVAEIANCYRPEEIQVTKVGDRLYLIPFPHLQAESRFRRYTIHELLDLRLAGTAKQPLSATLPALNAVENFLLFDERSSMPPLVEDHEAHRVARCLLCTDQELTPALVASCCAVLGSHRQSRDDLLFLLLSLPELFRVTQKRVVRPDDRGRPSQQDVVYVRVLLPPGTVVIFPCDTVPHLEERIKILSNVRRPLRNKIRECQRKLQYLRKPLPLLNHRTFAYALYDLIPEVDDEKTFFDIRSILSRLTWEQRQCRPAAVEVFLDDHNFLFEVSRHHAGPLFIRRRRGSEPAAQHVTTEELLMALYHAFPTRKIDPNVGCRYDGLMRYIPVRLRRELQRIGLHTVIEKHADQVESLTTDANKTESPHHIVIRFKGSLQEQLLLAHKEETGAGNIFST